LRLPLEIVRGGSQHVSGKGETKNLSSSGVLFTSEANLDIGEPIEYVIRLMSDSRGAGVVLRCLGKVLRRERRNGGAALAASLERYEFIREE
jgi:hypothetical protein